MQKAVAKVASAIIYISSQDVPNRNLVNSKQGERLRGAYAMLCHSVALRVLLQAYQSLCSDAWRPRFFH
jgi:hypothetical protein